MDGSGVAAVADADEDGRAMMTDIELKIPLALTESLIIRRMAVVFGESVDTTSALELACELHAIIDGYRRLRSVEPPYVGSNRYELMDIAAIEEPDMVLTILNTALGWWPEDEAAAASQSEWIAGQFSQADADDLYERYLRLCDRINGTDLASLL
jgi:hypothetical protein